MFKDCNPSTSKGQPQLKRTSRVYKHATMKLILKKMMTKGQLMLLEAHFYGLDEKHRKSSEALRNRRTENAIIKFLSWLMALII